MAKRWERAAAARELLADVVTSLDDQQRNAATLCAAWTPHLVLAHVTSFVDVPAPRFFWQIARARGDFDRAADVMARRVAERPTAEIAARLRERAHKGSPLPGFPEELTLVDVLVHLQDIRRPLGLGTDLPPELARAAVEFLTTSPTAHRLIGKDLVRGLAFRAPDVGFTTGSGPEIEAPAEVLLLALSRRPTVYDELGGIGADVLRTRLASS